MISYINIHYYLFYQIATLKMLILGKKKQANFSWWLLQKFDKVK